MRSGAVHADVAVGHRVRILRWDQREFILSFLERARIEGDAEGTVTHIEEFGSGRDLWIQIDGLKREYAFGPEQVERLACCGA